MLKYIFDKTPIYVRVFVYLAQNCELSREIKMGIYMIEKSEKPIATKLQVNLIELLILNLFFSQHT